MDLVSYLPREFPFYHLGTVSLDESASNISDQEPQFSGCVGVAFQLAGELNDWLVLVFERGLDLPTYAEVGNVIASRLATNLSRSGHEVTISPPRELRTQQLIQLLSSGSDGESAPRSSLYRHCHRGMTIVLRAYLLTGSAAHA